MLSTVVPKTKQKKQTFQQFVIFQIEDYLLLSQARIFKENYLQIVYCSAAPRINKDNSEILTWRAFAR